MRADYLECGKIINTHGVDGAVKLESWCDSPEILAGLRTLYMRRGGVMTAYKVIRASVFKRFVIVRLEGVSDIDTAQSLRGETLYAVRGDITLDEGDVFIADLIGLEVTDADSGKVYGRLADVINAGASDIYVVETEKGERMIPAVDEFIVRIDTERGIFVRPIEGMFD